MGSRALRRQRRTRGDAGDSACLYGAHRRATLCFPVMNSSALDQLANGKAVLTVAETAKALSVTRTAVYAWTKNGTLPSVRIGGVVRIPVDGLRNLLESSAAS